jgi:D-hexose-6-phosphate mutarotase
MSQDVITIQNSNSAGETLSATFDPRKGMNLLSYKKGDIEVIDQSTRPLFEERAAGLGALIGPHFHRRNSNILPKISNEKLFPHIAKVKAKGVDDPFSHGIARYAPWKAEASECRSSVTAELSGQDEWEGVPLADLQGQDFKFQFHADMTVESLEITLSIVSKSDSLIGFHYYYALPQRKGSVHSRVRDHYLDQGIQKDMQKTWVNNDGNSLEFNLDEEADYGFFPYLDHTRGEIILDAKTHKLKVNYDCGNEENTWQLYHPKGASFVCIEPISATNPRKPILTVSTIQLALSVV